MQRKTDLKEQEVIDASSSAMSKVKSCCHCRSRAVFRLLISMHGTPNPNLNHEKVARMSSPTASSVVHPIVQGRRQKKCDGGTQERGSREIKKQMDETVIRTQTKRMEIGNKESESPFYQKEQSLLKRAIRILFILFVILGVIVIFMTASQYVYLETGRLSRSCMNGFVKLRFVGMYNPPI